MLSRSSAQIYSFLLEPHLDPEPVANQIGVKLALGVATTRQLGGVPDRRHHRPDRRCLLLDRGWGEAYVALMVLGCVAVGAVAWLRERQVATTANGVPVEEPVPA